MAAYARVSTSSEEQLNSVEAQKDYFEKLILRKPGWILVGIYADEGITGTSMHRREAFKRMVADAMDGKIDLIVTKSLSRFARNTVDSLNIIRQLKDVRVGVYFEKEDIFALDSKGEFMITLLSSMAEEESRSISENIKWGHRKRFADGRHSVGYKHFLGFQKGADGGLEILEEEARIVRLIYLLFLEGYSPNAIAAMLTAAGIPTPTRKQLWPSSTILGILTNEKHYDAALLQKEFSADYRTKKKKRNCGELPMYYIANDHPSIVSKEIFDEVQCRLSQLQVHEKASPLFAGQLFCADCGGAYGPKKWHSTSYADTVWQCGNHHNHRYPCTTPHLYEELLKPVFHEVILKLLETHSEILQDCVESLAKSGAVLSEKEIPAAVAGADISSAAEKHIWRSVIEKVIVHPGHLLEFRFIDGSTISHQMTRTGLRRQRMAQVEKEQVWKAYLAGKSGKAISREMGFHPTTVYGFLRKQRKQAHTE